MTSEMSKMSLKSIRHSVDRSMSLGRKVMGYRMRTVSGLIYEDRLVKNMIMEIYYEVTNANPKGIYVIIYVCLERYNR